jgi:hypothetical protein
MATKRRRPNEQVEDSINGPSTENSEAAIEIQPLDVEFKLEQIITEEHRPPQIYSVRFCDTLPDYASYFASVGGNTASIYEIRQNNTVDLISAFLDEDVDEVLYSCAWGATNSGTPLLVSHQSPDLHPQTPF